MAEFPIKDNPEFLATMEQMTASTRASYEAFNPVWEQLLDNDGYLKREIERSQRMRTVTLYAAGWSDAYPYEQDVSLNGITAADNIKVIGIHIPDGADEDQIKAWEKAAGFLMFNENGVSDGTITFRAKKKPEVDFSVVTEGG